jgi:hypothetical protein
VALGRKPDDLFRRLGATDDFAGFSEGIEHACAGFGQPRAGGRESHAAPAPFAELRAQSCFQREQVMAQRRRREMQSQTGAGQAALSGNRLYQPQVAYLEREVVGLHR